VAAFAAAGNTSGSVASASASAAAAATGGAVTVGPSKLRAGDLVHCRVVCAPGGSPSDLEAESVKVVALAPRTSSASRQSWGAASQGTSKRNFNYGPSARGGGASREGANHGSDRRGNPGSTLGPRRGGSSNSSVVRSTFAARGELERSRTVGASSVRGTDRS